MLTTKIGLIIIIAIIIIMVKSVNTCNEQICTSIVTKCTESSHCKCDLSEPTCSCCYDCYKCLGHLYTDCCSCVGNKKIKIIIIWTII